MKVIFIFALVIVGLHLAFAEETNNLLAPVKIAKKDLKEDKDLKEVAKKLQSAKLVQMQFVKTIYNVITEEDTVSEGLLKVTRGKMRLEVNSPEKSTVVVNKNEIWVINFDLEDTEKATQVVHIKSGKEKVHQVMLSLLDGEKLLKNFEIKKSVRRGDILMFELKPTSNIDEVVKVQLAANSKNHTVNTIQYWDSADNKTKFDFSKIEFLEELDIKTFSFKPPKGVKIEEI